MQPQSDQEAARKLSAAPIRIIGAVVLAAALFATAGCERDAEPETAPIAETTLDRRPVQPPSAGAQGGVVLTLPSGAQVVGTEAAAELLAYLRSPEPAPRAFDLEALGFVDRENVRQDPDVALTTLVTVLNAFPQATVRAEVVEFNPDMNVPHGRAVDRAREVKEALVDHGLSPARVTSRGVDSPEPITPQAQLVVVSK